MQVFIGANLLTKDGPFAIDESCVKAFEKL